LLLMRVLSVLARRRSPPSVLAEARKGARHAAIALGLALLIWFVAWAVRRWQVRRAAQRLEQGIEADLSKATRPAQGKDRVEVQAVRQRLLEAIKTIKTSKLGELTGSAALYELPWYMVIGNPAAGKSTAVVQSGLKFPFASGNDNVIQGIGGTRNCDWFFTNEGILIDTAGRTRCATKTARVAGLPGDAQKHRPRAPINGI
jgi:type VI secretion system protein ImpL